MNVYLIRFPSEAIGYIFISLRSIQTSARAAFNGSQKGRNTLRAALFGVSLVYEG